MSKRTISIGRQELSTLLKGDLKTVFNASGTIKYKQGIGRIVVVVSSKQEKRAVYRNKIKRRARAIFISEKIPHDVVFYPSKKSLVMPYPEFKVHFHELIKKI